MADDDDGVDFMDGTDVLPDSMLNKVNRGLKAQIVLYEQEVENKGKEITDNKTRLALMSEHLTNVRLEIKNTQELCEAKKRVCAVPIPMCNPISQQKMHFQCVQIFPCFALWLM